MKLSIQKFDPSIDREPYYKDYEVPWEEYLTALAAFVYIDETIEPLAHDFSCRGRNCGRCSVMVDGEPVTSCTKVLTDAPHIIEPLKGVPVIRDLVVERRAMQDRISRISLRERANQLTIDDVMAPVPYETYEKLDGFERCSRCLVCNASCPVRDTMPDRYIGPAGMVAIALRHEDPYDEGDRITQAVQEGMWNCIMCGKCDEVCHTLEIDHVGTWQKLRDEASIRKLTKGAAPILPFNQ
jgi:fumarate reductase iron-sulfur subunit/fumarate reductase (CoM/CoB) subunit B